MGTKPYLLLAGACALLASGFFATAAKADPVATPALFNFDPTGTGNFTGPQAVQDVAAISVLPGNVLAQGGNSAFVNFLNGGPASGNNFVAAGHFQVGTLNGTTSYSPAAATTSMSVSFRFPEVVTNAALTGGVAAAVFGFPSSPSGANFVNLYFNNIPGSGTAFYNAIGTANANNLGFQNGIGGAAIPILTGHVIGTLTTTSGMLQTVTTATTLQSATATALDQHLGAGAPIVNNYPGLNTQPFNGATRVIVQVDNYNRNYLQGIGGDIAFLSLPDFTNNNPFTTVDPSSNFGSEGFPNNGAGPNNVGGVGTDTLGTNGLVTGGPPGGPFVASGPDIQFTSIGSASALIVQQVVTSSVIPEIDPNSIAGALTLLGGGLLLLRERRLRRKS
jgi:hypothetical protein